MPSGGGTVHINRDWACLCKLHGKTPGSLMSQYGFSTFDKKDAENGLTSPQTAGPLTPAEATGWAFESNFSNGSYEGCTGFIQIYNTSGNVVGIQPLSSINPVSINNAVASGGWITNLLIFNGVSYPITCTLLSVQVTSNVCTIATSAQHFIVGTQIQFPSGLNSAFLNSQLVTILSNDGTHITFNFSHADVGPTSESAGITNFPYLQMVDAAATASNTGGTAQGLTLPNNVTPGSTILVFLTHGDVNTFCTIASVSDGTNTYSVSNIQGTGGGADPGTFANFAWAVNSSSGSLTVTTTSGTYHNPSGGGRYVVMELPGLPTLVSIAVTPTSPSIAIGNTQQFTATGTYSDNSTQNLTSTATWASATTSVATIAAGGLATGVSAGTSNITATAGSVVSPADTLTVTSSPIVQGKGFIPLPFSQRTTAAVAVFACLQIAAPGTILRTLAADVPTIIALQFSYAKLLDNYGILRRQDIVNQRVILVAAVAAAVDIISSLNATVSGMSANGDNAFVLAGIHSVVAGALTQVRDVQFDES